MIDSCLRIFLCSFLSFVHYSKSAYSCGNGIIRGFERAIKLDVSKRIKFHDKIRQFFKKVNPYLLHRLRDIVFEVLLLLLIDFVQLKN